MAEVNTTFTPPSPTMTTELYYKKSGATTQVFGVQSIPPFQGTPEDLTYRTLESTEEFAAPGVKAFSAIEVECLLYKEQWEAMIALSNGDDVDWYVKLPDDYEKVFHWKGKFILTLASIDLDSMYMCTLKIYKSTQVEELSAIPA
jgi:hypothetical protein